MAKKPKIYDPENPKDVEAFIKKNRLTRKLNQSKVKLVDPQYDWHQMITLDLEYTSEVSYVMEKVQHAIDVAKKMYGDDVVVCVEGHREVNEYEDLCFFVRIPETEEEFYERVKKDMRNQAKQHEDRYQMYLKLKSEYDPSV